MPGTLIFADQVDDVTCADLAGGSLENWPNCIVPDCEYKACLSLGSDKCYAHSRSLQPIPFSEYEALNEDDDEDEDDDGAL